MTTRDGVIGYVTIGDTHMCTMKGHQEVSLSYLPLLSYSRPWQAVSSVGSDYSVGGLPRLWLVQSKASASSLAPLEVESLSRPGPSTPSSAYPPAGLLSPVQQIPQDILPPQLQPHPPPLCPFLSLPGALVGPPGQCPGIDH